MKHLPFIFGMLALAATLAAIWRPDYLWQLLLTAAVFAVTAAAIAGQKQGKAHE